MVYPASSAMLANRRFAERTFNLTSIPDDNTARHHSNQIDSIEINHKPNYIEARPIITEIFNEFEKLNLSPKALKEHGNIYFLNCLMQNPKFIPMLCKEKNLSEKQKNELIVAKREINEIIRLQPDYQASRSNTEKEQFNDFVKKLQVSYRAFVGISNNYTLESLGTWAFNNKGDALTGKSTISNIHPSVFRLNDKTPPNNSKTENISEAEHGALLTSARVTLKANILCQDEALDSLINKFLYHYCNQTAVSHFKRNRESQPWVRAILYGPSGVGKTTAAELLSNALGRPVIKIDLNAYKTEESVSRFTGAESGRVGFMSGCSVPEQIEKAIAVNPKPPIIIFDEFEKAHPYIQHMIMGLLDTGKMPKADLTNVDAKGVDIIATTNAGVDKMNKFIKQGVKGHELKKNAEIAMEDEFPPEIIGRFNSKIFFKPLEESDVDTIVKNQIAKNKALVI